MAAAIGNVTDDGVRPVRSGFSHPPGQYEGPYDVLRYSLRHLGDHAAADAAEVKFQHAMALRKGQLGPQQDDAEES